MSVEIAPLSGSDWLTEEIEHHMPETTRAVSRAG